MPSWTLRKTVLLLGRRYTDSHSALASLVLFARVSACALTERRQLVESMYE